MRVVSLACSNTEIVCALGCADLLVGVDDHSDHPAEVVARLPRLGPDLTPDVDRVAALDPDLVLASLTVPGHERVLERLEAAGLPYLAPEPVALADVYRDIETVAGRLGVAERGRTLAAEMRRALTPVAAAAHPPAILVEWWPKPVIAPGRLSWVHDLLALAGACNPLGDQEVKSRPLGDDELVALAPDAVVVCWCGVPFERYRPDVVYRNPAYAASPALRNRQVHCVPEAFLGRPSPRLVQGYEALKAVAASARARRPAPEGH